MDLLKVMVGTVVAIALMGGMVSLFVLAIEKDNMWYMGLGGVCGACFALLYYHLNNEHGSGKSKIMRQIEREEKERKRRE